MNFNLSILLEAVNREAGKKVDFLLTKDSKVLITAGELDYSFDNEKLEDVLKQNNFNHYHKSDTIEKINEILSKHIVDQLTIKN